MVTKKNVQKKINAPNRVRTCDLTINSRALYQLSYQSKKNFKSLRMDLNHRPCGYEPHALSYCATQRTNLLHSLCFDLLK